MATATAAQIKTRYAEAMALQKEGKSDAAARLYLEILDVNRNIAEPHYQMAVILAAADSFTAAMQHAAEAAALKPAEGAIWQIWSDAVALGGDAQAEARFLAALKFAAPPVELKLALQDRFGARRAGTRPKTGGASPVDIRKVLAALQAGQLPQVERLTSALLTKHPQSAVLMNIRATALALQGKGAQAEATYRQAIRTDPAYAEAHDNLGRLLIDLGRPTEAVALFRKALMLAPGLPSALVNFSSALNRAGKASVALILLERAERQGIANAPLFMAIGNSKLHLKDTIGAEAAFRKAIVHANGNAPEAEAMLGQVLAKQERDEEALKCFDAALARNPSQAAALAGKASLLQTLGDFDAANELFLRSIEANPDHGETYRVYLASHKAQPGEPIIDRMKERFADPRLGDEDRMNMGFALAKALEDVRQDDEVFRYLNAANAIVRRQQPHSMQNRLKAVEMTKRAYSGIDWQSRLIDRPLASAPIFVTGMPRSGTTLIEQIIASHSQVTSGGEIGDATLAAHQFLASGQEARPLSQISDAEIADLGESLSTLYKTRFPGAVHVADKSIQTYMHMGLIKLALPAARFIVVRRDPRDNLLSMYKNKFPENAHPYAYDQRELAQYYGTFVDMIDFWRSQIPDWFYEVQYEALVADPETEAPKLIAACGLDWEESCLNFHENKNKVKTLSIYQVRQPISKASVKGWRRFEKDLKPMLDALREGGHVTD